VHDREEHAVSAGEVYVRTAEAARILGRSPKTISRWARAGKLPHIVTLGGHRRFPAVAVYELARQMEGGLRVVRDVQR
jgi:excisionase family DNA binding protein